MLAAAGAAPAPFLRQLLASRFEPLAAAASAAASAAHAHAHAHAQAPPPQQPQPQPQPARKRRRVPPPLPEWPVLEAALRDAAADGVQVLDT